MRYMRVGIIALQHEANTFSRQRVTLEEFNVEGILTGSPMRDRFIRAHHEIGGFFEGLDAAQIDAVPIFAARATPGGTIAAESYRTLLDRMLAALREAMTEHDGR